MKNVQNEAEIEVGGGYPPFPLRKDIGGDGGKTPTFTSGDWSGGKQLYDTLVRKIRMSKELRQYTRLASRYASHLNYIEEHKAVCQLYDTRTCQLSAVEFPYYNRASAEYNNILYAKLSDLERYYKKNPCKVTFMTLTTSHKGKTIREVFEELREGWRCMTTAIRNYRRVNHCSLEYLYVFEEHKSGYPHMHVILFGDLEKEDFDRLRRLWSDKWKHGSYEHGCKIDEVKEYNGIQYLRAYLLKYVQKSVKDLTPSRFVFLAVMWSFYDTQQWAKKIPVQKSNGLYKAVSTGGGAFRLWGVSRGLQEAMKSPKKKNPEPGVNYSRPGEEFEEWQFRIIRRLSISARLAELESIGVGT